MLGTDVIVAVVMSTYNGAEYIKEQINSILSQGYSDFSLYIRDDGSSDNTLGIIHEYCEKDKRVSLYSDLKGNLGPAGSFLEMINNISADVYMFADQDDVWLQNKISDAILFFKNNKDNKPKLYCTDLKVVDKNLNVISDSFMVRENYNPVKQNSLGRLLFQNFVVGCTSAINKELVDVFKTSNSKECIKNIIMHDWWFALLAVTYGEIFFNPKASILYRQHGRNSIGSTGSGFSKIKHVIFTEGLHRKSQKYFSMIKEQFLSFYCLHPNCLSNLEPKLASSLKCYFNENSPRHFIYCLYKNCGMYGFLRNLSLIYYSIHK